MYKRQGRICEYVKEFQELLLEIPKMGEQDTLFCFLDGLRSWARMELERRGVQDFTFAIAAAESLIELKKDSSKGRGKKGHEDSYSEGDRDRSPKRDHRRNIKATVRRKKHRRSIRASFTTGLIEFSSARNAGNLPLL